MYICFLRSGNSGRGRGWRTLPGNISYHIWKRTSELPIDDSVISLQLINDRWTFLSSRTWARHHGISLDTIIEFIQNNDHTESSAWQWLHVSNMDNGHILLWWFQDTSEKNVHCITLCKLTQQSLLLMNEKLTLCIKVYIFLLIHEPLCRQRVMLLNMEIKTY